MFEIQTSHLMTAFIVLRYVKHTPVFQGTGFLSTIGKQVLILGDHEYQAREFGFHSNGNE